MAQIRQEYEDRPSCLRYLFESSARQQLVDFFLDLGIEWDDDEEPLTKADIIEATGMQRKSIIDHIPALVEMGIVKEIEGSRWERYEPAIENDQYQVLIHANDLLWEYFEEQ